MSRGPAPYAHKHAYKLSVTYELPFLKSEKGFVGHALGGWSLGSFYQLYSGHPIDVHVGAPGTGNNRFRAKDAAGQLMLHQNGRPFNVGDGHKLDGVYTDHPDFIGTTTSSA